ncbi:MAG: FAD-dependent thymidylate synthase [Pseudomonas sp.]|nr:FAD-dependent thymidylate synthase [Pseudomonas sp.]
MKAELIDYMGSDARVVDAARVSFSKQADNYTEAQNDRLIGYLAKHNHFTPFTHPQITLRETVPIFVARQRLKHYIGFTYNEVSRRYVDDTPEFFMPEVWRSRPEGSMKQGSGDAHPRSDTWVNSYNSFIELALRQYEAMIKDGVAPEQARMALPQSMLTSYYVTGSLAAFGRAFKQRIDVHAQVEIQELAKQWGEIIQPLFPVSWAALTK